MKETVVLKNHLTGEIREVEPTPELLSRLMGVEGFHQHNPPAASVAELGFTVGAVSVEKLSVGTIELSGEDSPEFIEGADKAMDAIAKSEVK